MAMLLLRRYFIRLAGAAIVLPATSRTIFAQSPQGAPRLTQILRADLQGQDQKVQETVVNVLEMASGFSAPWHMHPGAQEIIYVLDGSLTAEVEGQETRAIKAGEIALIPAEIPHLVRNEGSSAMARALVSHSRADKKAPFQVIVKRAT
jgi:quercetin dioxygenase-like cupin family protein